MRSGGGGGGGGGGPKWGLGAYVVVHTILPPSPDILWIELGGKPKWLPLNFRDHGVKCPATIIPENRLEKAGLVFFFSLEDLKLATPVVKEAVIGAS